MSIVCIPLANRSMGCTIGPGRVIVAGNYDREQIRVALALNDPAMSSYLDLETGNVIYINETDQSAETETLRDAIMSAYGDRYRYIPGGNPSAEQSAVTTWLEAEGLT